MDLESSFAILIKNIKKQRKILYINKSKNKNQEKLKEEK